MSLVALVRSPWCEDLGWALYHSLWQGALAALAVAIVLAITRSPRIRYAAACGALSATLGAFLYTAVRHWPGFWGRARGGAWPAVPYAADLAAPDGSAALWRAADLIPWLVPLWMAGVILIQAYAIGGWVAAERLRRRAVCAAPREWQARWRELAARMRVSTPAALLESGLAEVPAVIGWLRPVVLVPAGLFASMPPAQVEAILLHELAHIRRRDYLVNLVETAAESLLFYHPAVWWISGVIRAEREHCCDDLAVAAGAGGGNARAYAAALVALEQARGWESVGSAAMAATGGNLMNRIERLVRPRASARQAAWPAAALVVTITAVGLLAVLATAAPPPQQQAGPRAEGPYTKWLNEDVVYIIEPRERSAFSALRTDEERERFIEQFWQRRDPTPATPAENEFKEEHYRRIAYANERFPSKKAAGWRTDRGRIYIRFGPPDEIESHPSTRDHAAPFENWLYHSLPGIGDRVIVEFVDQDRDGSYRQTLDPREPQQQQPRKKQ